VTEPLVSVVIPAFDAERHLAETLDSALAQTWRRCEVIVVDDGSTDGTTRVARSRGDRVRLLRQANAGGGAARNRGIREARGDFVALLDHDDLWHPETLERQVAVALRHPESGLVACDGVEVGASGVLQPRLFGPAIARRLDAEPAGEITDWLFKELVARNFVSCFSHTLIPRAVLERIGPIETGRGEAYDYDTLLRISAAYPLTLHAAALVTRRFVGTNRSGSLERRKIQWSVMSVRALRRQLALHPEHAPLIRRSLRERVRRGNLKALRLGRPGDGGFAAETLVELLRLHPTARGALFLAALSLRRAFVNAAGRRSGCGPRS
jgi:glycosyltransferase involved in cell wall biosynthesis